MVAYREYAELQNSPHSERRGQAARIAAQAFLTQEADEAEHAALYASLLSFLDDPSVRVRAALAYELLHSKDAPRPIMFALAQDAAIIARAVVQYSPVLLEADLLTLVRTAGTELRLTAIDRDNVSEALARALIESADRAIDRAIVLRPDIAVSADDLVTLADRWCEDIELRALLLDRADLPPVARYLLVEKTVAALAQVRIVRGSIESKRLDRLMRDAMDQATTRLAEEELAEGGQQLVEALVDAGRVSTRLVLHSLVTGRVVFFAATVALLSEMPAGKVLSILGDGRRAALFAVFARCGFAEGLRNVLAGLVAEARETDLSADIAARHAIVAGLIEEMISDHEGDIPAELRGAFAYLNEQNVALARHAARGMMANFIEQAPQGHAMIPVTLRDHAPALPAP
ncbi:MAG: DUF2336 domain-containing protein [Cucumibacter sp.]